MRVQSTVRPSDFFIRKSHLGNVHLILRKNITELVTEVEGDEEDIQVIFNYDEVEVVISNRENLTEYVLDNFDSLYDLGVEQEKKKKNEEIDEVTGLKQELDLVKTVLDDIILNGGGF